MAKFGIGVGEEFPVEDAKLPQPPREDGEGLERRRRHWRWHRIIHFAARLALIALMISAIAWLFRPRAYFYPDPYFPYGFYPYPHHFFFPFFPLLLLGLLIAFAWHGRGCYHAMHHHWHRHDADDRRGEGA